MNKHKLTLIFHPILFAVCPILSFYTVNRNIVLFHTFLRDVLITVFLVVLVWIALSYWFKSQVKGSIFLTTCLFLFLSFRFLMLGFLGLGILFGRQDEARRLIETRPAMIIWFIICVGIFFTIQLLIKFNRINLVRFSYLLSIVSGVWFLAILIPSYLVPYVSSLINPLPPVTNFDDSWVAEMNNETCAVTNSSVQLPDIYYIILDGYARDDVLMNTYQVANDDFLAALERLGFYVARDSRANYKMTNLSLASSLNYEFLDELSNETGLDAADRSHLQAVITNNRTFHQLKCLGYKIISFESGFYYTDITTADKSYSPSRNMKSFETLLLNNTPLSILTLETPYDWHRERITYTLDKLYEIAQIEYPKFVFAHIISPHPPFIFGPNGEPRYPQRLFMMNDGPRLLAVSSESEYIEGYRDQVIYISKLVIPSIIGILDNSARPPIIILQGDHGTALHFDLNLLEKTDVQERFPILNAYYLPGVQGDQVLYSDITPVNTFRVIFNTYFESNYPLREDKSFYTPEDDFYNFTDITEKIADNLRAR